jgi:hypothetical protein
MSKAVQLCAASMLALAGGALAQPAAAATFFFTDTPYRSEADIPAGFYAGGGAPTLLENFEDGSLDASLSASAGSVLNPGGLTDSVDADDGLINGSGTAGRSWFSGAGSSGVTFTFKGAVLPTAFGIVWTDSGFGASVTFRATAGDGSLLGSITRSGFSDNSNSGTTLEDRFFGVTFAGGIKSVFISNSSGGIEVDHVQYGAMATPVPLPAAGWLMLTGLAGLVVRRRSRH